jgi:hypothetical protein
MLSPYFASRPLRCHSSIGVKPGRQDFAAADAVHLFADDRGGLL